MRVPGTLLRALVIGASALATLVPACAAHADPTPAEVQSQIEKASNELEDVIEAYNGINEDIKTTQSKVADVAARIKTITEQITEVESDVQTVVTAAYRGSGNLRTVSIILGAGSADGLLDQMTTLKHITRSQQRDIASYNQLRADLEQENDRYATLMADQTTQQRQLADRKTTIEGNIRDLETLKRKVSTPPVSSDVSRGTKTPAVSGAAGKAVSFAYAQLGKPYVWGADGPSGYDCSGLTMAAWSRAGVSLPHNAKQQWGKVAHIQRGSLQPGDLVFYRSLGHVGIYVGNGNIIHAPHTGDVVRVADVDIMSPYGYGRPR
ncbi:MAG: C40 family peptidase [Micromonosporaceae bacterium]|nr:C40 family peptidase [Micromonosporaceae bacterium]